MTITRRFNFSTLDKITAIGVQPDDTYLWIAYAEDDGICTLRKTWGFTPSQTFFNIEKEVDEIVAIALDDELVYLAYEDDDLLGEILGVNNPLNFTIEIEKPSGISETPVDVQVNGADLWFLLPGSLSGTNAKLLKYTTGGSFDQEIDLSDSLNTVTDASTFAIDDNGDLWIVTNTSPATIVRVYELSGGPWTFSVTEII